MKYYLFPKFFLNCTTEELMAYTAELGFDGPTALVREGYALTPENLREALPTYLAAARREGLTVAYANTPFDMAHIEDFEDGIRCLKEYGITQFRLNHVPKNVAPARELAPRLREMAQRTEALMQKIGGIQAIIQIHGYCYPHNATAAYAAVQGLDPACIGVKLDPGNNICQEGYELFSYQIDLLGEYIAAVSGKDVSITRTGNQQAADKGWRRAFVPADEGIIDYVPIFRQLKEQGFHGPLIMMPFYHENDLPRHLDGLRRDMRYFKACEQAARGGEAR